MSNATAKVGYYEQEIRKLKRAYIDLKKLFREAIDLGEEANGDPSACPYNTLIGERLKELRKAAE